MRILDDVLDLSKIEAGKMDLEPIDFDTEELVQSSANLRRPRAESKGLTFKVELAKDAPTRLHGDPVRIKQILFNLIGNAIKFTSEGSVHTLIRVLPLTPGRAVIRAEVTDTGPGLAPDVQKKLFHAFSQGDGATSRKFGGTGLGLAICKRLVELMGGTIDVKSTVGEGSTFWFEAPLKIAVEAQPAPKAATTTTTAPAQPAIESPRILLAEDNPINQEVICGFLKFRGWNCDIANDGMEAVDAFKAGAFDLVLMDVQMPAMDGYAATRAIRQTGRAGETTPIIALTANAMRSDQQRCLDADMDGYVAKPIDRQKFFAEMDRWLESGRDIVQGDQANTG